MRPLGEWVFVLGVTLVWGVVNFIYPGKYLALFDPGNFVLKSDGPLPKVQNGASVECVKPLSSTILFKKRNHYTSFVPIL